LRVLKCIFHHICEFSFTRTNNRHYLKEGKGFFVFCFFVSQFCRLHFMTFWLQYFGPVVAQNFKARAFGTGGQFTSGWSEHKEKDKDVHPTTLL
jgi:hypothetical protein